MRVLFFGRLADIAGARERTAPAGLASLDALKTWACETNPDLRAALNAKSVRVAINKTIIHGDPRLNDADEIAFMPPLSGG